MIEIGIFGGTGIYDSGILANEEMVKTPTPYGDASDAITVGTFKGRRLGFLPRHGRRHSLAPHMINYRANVWALQSMGATRIIAPSAVGSLRQEVQPGHFALPAQFIDFTKTRVTSFTKQGGVIHISVADPFCPELQRCVSDAAKSQNMILHQNCTYICIEGPRFSTRAESNMYRATGADIIGMTLVPECALAREARMCYVSVSMVTDYDVWAEQPVTAKEVASTVSKNAHRFQDMLKLLISGIPSSRKCSCAQAMDDATF